MCKKVKNAKEALEVFNAKFEKLKGKIDAKFTKKYIQILGESNGLVAYIYQSDANDETYVVAYHSDRSPSIEKTSNVRIFKEIKSPKEAYNAFCAEYPSLIRSINPAAPAYDGYKFEKKTIRIRQGGTFEAYVGHNYAKEYYFVVPVDGGVPKIETFEEITVIK